METFSPGSTCLLLRCRNVLFDITLCYCYQIHGIAADIFADIFADTTIFRQYFLTGDTPGGYVVRHTPDVSWKKSGILGVFQTSKIPGKPRTSLVLRRILACSRHWRHRRIVCFFADIADIWALSACRLTCRLHKNRKGFA